MPAFWSALSPEGLLAALLVLLYLKDSLWLLAADEAVLRRGPRGMWHASFGQRGFKLAGREPYLLHPFKPQQAAWRLRWRMATPAASDARGGAGQATPPGAAPATRVSLKPLAAPPELARLAPWAWAIWSLLFVGLPVTVLGRLGTLSTLAVAAALYGSIAVALVLVWRWRMRLGIAPRAAALLAFECLACPPYAANLVRRVAAAMAPQEDFVSAAQRLLPPDALATVHRECLARIDDQLEAEPEHSPRATALRDARARFGVKA